DYPRIEAIIMDAGSTDDTAEIVQEYGDHFTWICEPDRGQSHAINKGFRMARGEIITWVNSDDVLLPGAVTAVVDAFESDPRVAMVYGDAHVIDDTGNIIFSVRSPEPNPWSLANVADYIVQ